MNALQEDWISPAKYLARELGASCKSEYVGGAVYAMSGAKNRHNRIATNATGALVHRLRGRRCQAFNSDTKVRIQLATHVRFYYPDAMVVCDSNREEDAFQDAPSVVIEVLSNRTRRTDESEKKDAYFTIPSLRVYLLVEQNETLVVALRRTDQGFVREKYEGLQAVVPLPEIEAELPLAELYERVRFGQEPEEDED
ncbi:Uma2 family endonuclease [bacterium]|nr:Uma2 family endonuclease [bacterium]